MRHIARRPTNWRGVEVRHPRLQRVLGVVGGRRQVVDEQLDQRCQVAVEVVEGARALPGTPGRRERSSRRRGSRAGRCRRRGPGRAPRPRAPPRRCGRRDGRSCSPPGSPAGRARGSCAARSGSGAGVPRTASTSSSTPSTMVSARSTSPPKSAWPGVSTMFTLTVVPSSRRQRTAVFLARIVMPFSRSRSMVSITRSAVGTRAVRGARTDATGRPRAWSCRGRRGR